MTITLLQCHRITSKCPDSHEGAHKKTRYPDSDSPQNKRSKENGFIPPPPSRYYFSNCAGAGGVLEDGEKKREERRRREPGAGEPSCLLIHKQNDMHIYGSESYRGEGSNTKEPFIA